MAEKEKEEEDKDETTAKKRRLTDETATSNGVDPAYFESYADIRVHEDMLRDFVRTDTYRKAIEACHEQLHGKVVLDVGGGTGILSIFAAREGGARKVYCVEASDIAEVAQQNIAVNGVAHIVTIIRGRMEDIELPEKVDAIISEWMGYCLLYESMLESVIFARNRWLKPGGLLFPQHARVQLALLGNDDYYESRVQFWDNIKQMYNVDMAFVGEKLRHAGLQEAIIDHVNAENILSNSATIVDLDLHVIQPDDLIRIHSTFTLNSMVSCTMHGLITWFDVTFPSSGLTLSTSPYQTETHWKQTCLYSHLSPPLQLHQDDVVSGNICLSKNKINHRGLDIHLVAMFQKDGSAIDRKFTLSPDPVQSFSTF